MNIKITRPGVKLSPREKETLASAYFKLYDALVQKFKNKNMSFGESWFNAMCETEKIIEKLNTQNPNVATQYLTDFCKSHKKSQSRKMMTDESKNNVLPPSQKSQEAEASAKSATQEFEKTIRTFDTLTILAEVETKNIPVNASNDFFAWVQTLPPSACGNLEEPDAFQKLYNKFMKRRHM